MPRYAVKIGELYLEAEQPITDAERRVATAALASEAPNGVIAQGAGFRATLRFTPDTLKDR